MQDKPVIDGIECRYWFRVNPRDYRKCSLRGGNDNCDEIKDCFIKELLGKLALKEQECEELKHEVELMMDCASCKVDEYKQTLTEIKEITEPYQMTIKKICGNCKKYDDCHACCYKDINCYKYTSSKTDACKEFTYLDEFIPNLLANNILQKINECETENE